MFTENGQIISQLASSSDPSFHKKTKDKNKSYLREIITWEEAELLTETLSLSYDSTTDDAIPLLKESIKETSDNIKEKTASLKFQMTILDRLEAILDARK